MKRYNASSIQVLEVCGAGKLRGRFEEELGIEPWNGVAKARRGSKKRSVDRKL
jgi:hypothetical protein